MRSSDARAGMLPVLASLLCTVAAAGESPWVAGGGVEADSDDSVAVTAFADVGLAERTWLRGSVSYSELGSPRRRGEERNWYGELGLDHYFEPVGARLAVARWGDPDSLRSTDYRGRLYWRSSSSYLALDAEHRDFDFDFPAFGLFPGRTVTFDAAGLGATWRIDAGERADLSLSGIAYDYSIDLSLGENRPLRDLATVTRLSLFSSLVDYRLLAGLGIDVGLARWQVDVGRRKDAIDGGRSTTATLRFLAPWTDRTDVELALGYDDAESYGDAVFLSVFLLYYGG